jgi:hypothetical protein
VYISEYLCLLVNSLLGSYVLSILDPYDFWKDKPSFYVWLFVMGIRSTFPIVQMSEVGVNFRRHSNCPTFCIIGCS